MCRNDVWRSRRGSRLIRTDHLRRRHGDTWMVVAGARTQAFIWLLGVVFSSFLFVWCISISPSPWDPGPGCDALIEGNALPRHPEHASRSMRHDGRPASRHDVSLQHLQEIPWKPAQPARPPGHGRASQAGPLCLLAAMSSLSSTCVCVCERKMIK